MKKWVVYEVKNLDQIEINKKYENKSLEELAEDKEYLSEDIKPLAEFFYSLRKARKSIKGFKGGIWKITYYLHQLVPQGNCISKKEELIETRGVSNVKS